MSSTENNRNASLIIDSRHADAGYKPFPSFADWRKIINIDTRRWGRYKTQLEKNKHVSPALLRRAEEIVELAAAIDTGAIEGLYEVDRGFTFTVATQAAIWQTIVEKEKGVKVRSLIESQLKAYEYVLDLATQQVPIAEAWIRSLHAVICEGQDTYTAYTEIGLQELPLPKGEYKHLPNHVLRKDEKIHSYAPVDSTPIEMHRLCVELRSEDFLSSHPVLQASYAHYAFVVIHPFADGNGRVARALASVFTYRANSTPLLILVENRSQYLVSLEASDRGEYQPFVDFVLERASDSIMLFNESLRTASIPATEDSIADIKRLYVTKGGYSHAEVDEAGYKLFELFKAELEKSQTKLSITGMLEFVVNVDQEGSNVKGSLYRQPITQGAPRLIISISTKPPAAAGVRSVFTLEVPRDCGLDDDIIIRSLQTNESFEARITELMPVVSAVLQMRMSIAVQRIIGELISELKGKASDSLDDQ